MLNVYYYYFYLFYSRVLKDNEPHMLTVLAISAAEGFFINGIIDVITITFYCYSVNIWSRIAIVFFFIFFNYFYFHKSGKAKEIVKKKPMLFGNHKFSVIITLLSFLIAISWMFWGSFYAKTCN